MITRTARTELRSDAFAGKLVPAWVEPLPLKDVEGDYAAAFALKPVPQTEPRLSFVQKHQLLAALVAEIRRSLGEHSGIILINAMIQSPRLERMPRELLVPDIFFLSDAAVEARYLLEEGIAHVFIEDHLVRHFFEKGDNTLTLSWTSFCPDANERWNNLRQSFATLGLDEFPCGSEAT